MLPTFQEGILDTSIKLLLKSVEMEAVIGL